MSRSAPAALLAAVSLLSILAAQEKAPHATPARDDRVVVADGARDGDVRRMPLPGARFTLSPPSADVVRQEDGLWGVGDAYKIRFDEAGVEFHPALGSAAPRNYPLSYSLQAVGRGAELGAVADGERKVDGLRVEYARGALVERYDVRPEGVEQSFVFATLPPGAGDLVVRGAFRTDMRVEPADGGLLLTLDGVGGFRVHGVVGIDAAGRRAAGTIRHTDGVVEYTLPAAFVESAALPLVLDPLVGSVFTVANGADDQNPDVAYDLTNDVYLVVYERVFSSSDYDIHGQRVGGNGALVGGRIYIENSTQFDYQPSVCNINLRDRFVVVWTRWNTPNYDVWAQSIDAATGARLPANLAIATSTDIEYYPDVSGEATTVDDDALCVWSNLASDSVMAAQIGVNSDGTIYVWDTTTIYTSSVRPLYPRIDKSGGDTGRHMIVWSREYSTSDYDPQGAIVNRELTLLDSFISFDSAVNYTQYPAVDGDGNTWVVAWQVRESTGTENDIAVRGCALDAAQSIGHLLTPITLIESDPADNEINASVCWAGDSFLVGFADEIASPNYEVSFKSIDPFTCAFCENEFFVLGAYAHDFGFEAASVRSGGSRLDDALLVIETYDSTTTSSDVQAQRWESRDGTVVNLGGGCGAEAGASYATCAIHGNAGFEARVVGGVPSTSALLVGSRGVASIPCGTCRLLPDPYAGFVHATATDSYGDASFAAAIPPSTAVVGVTFYTQWVLIEPGSPGCYLFGADLSDALRMTIQ